MAWTHRLSEVDRETKTGICSNCGPVTVKFGKTNQRCNEAVKETKRKSDRHKDYNQAWAKQNMDRVRTYNYQLTPEGYQDLLTQQDNACAICRRPFGDTTPHIDHDHATDVVRGLLCPGCNIGLGHFKDNPKVLAAAVDYLTK